MSGTYSGTLSAPVNITFSGDFRGTMNLGSPMSVSGTFTTGLLAGGVFNGIVSGNSFSGTFSGSFNQGGVSGTVNGPVSGYVTGDDVNGNNFVISGSFDDGYESNLGNGTCNGTINGSGIGNGSGSGSGGTGTGTGGGGSTGTGSSGSGSGSDGSGSGGSGSGLGGGSTSTGTGSGGGSTSTGSGGGNTSTGSGGGSTSTGSGGGGSTSTGSGGGSTSTGSGSSGSGGSTGTGSGGGSTSTGSGGGSTSTGSGGSTSTGSGGSTSTGSGGSTSTGSGGSTSTGSGGGSTSTGSGGSGSGSSGSGSGSGSGGSGSGSGGSGSGSGGPIISGEVWLDRNDNGILETGEPVLQTINVNLLDATGDIVDSTSTDDNGDYYFAGLSPNTPYTVQFIAPNGYVFSPQNVGPPATSSSPGPDGSTDPITLSPDQDDNTVNAGLFGSAPIVYQTNVSMLAENQSYTDIDFTADGYDPNDELLTPVIVQGPLHGSLVFDTSTGLYDYEADSNYTGLDSFQFQLRDSHQAQSDVVTVQILAYSGFIQPGVYDNFPLLTQAVFIGNNGNPSQSSVKQGPTIEGVQQGIADCWFVADAAGLAQQNPGQIKSIITDNGNGSYTVKFPNHAAVTINFAGDANTYSTSNGDWLKILEKAYGQMVWNEKSVTWGNKPYNYINRGAPLSTGIEVLTGHSTDTDDFWATRDSTTRQKLINALVNGKETVTACIAGGSKKKAQHDGLVANHAYTVVAFDPETNQVRLRNPWGFNPVFNNGSDPDFWLGKNDPDNPNPNTLPAGGNGYFWMSLSDFTKKFSEICYEQ